MQVLIMFFEVWITVQKPVVEEYVVLVLLQFVFSFIWLSFTVLFIFIWLVLMI